MLVLPLNPKFEIVPAAFKETETLDKMFIFRRFFRVSKLGKNIGLFNICNEIDLVVFTPAFGPHEENNANERLTAYAVTNIILIEYFRIRGH